MEENNYNEQKEMHISIKINRERERNLNGKGMLGSKWGFLNWGGKVIMKNISAHSNFCSSETTKTWPYPSTPSPSLCPNFFFSSIGRSKNSWAPLFTLSSNEVLTPWLINCMYHQFVINMHVCGTIRTCIIHSPIWKQARTMHK